MNTMTAISVGCTKRALTGAHLNKDLSILIFIKWEGGNTEHFTTIVATHTGTVTHHLQEGLEIFLQHMSSDDRAFRPNCCRQMGQCKRKIFHQMFLCFEG